MFDFELGAADLEKGYAESNAFSVPDSGLYPATILAAYEITSNSSESKSIEVMYQTDSGYKGQQAIWYVGKNGLNTRQNDKGETVPTYGMVELQNLFAATGITAADLGASETTGTVKRFGQDQQVKLYDALTDKKVILGLRKKMEDGYNNPAESKEFVEVELWANLSGQTGEELNSKHKPKTIAIFEGIIAKKPVVDRRKFSLPAEDAPFDGSTDTEANAALAGWDG